jgi:hypothetical protein
MATFDRSVSTKRGAGALAYVRVSQRASFTFVDNATVKVQVNAPAGATRPTVTLETPTALSGTPTTANFRCGTTDTGQQVVADVDAKAQGHITCTMVAGLDRATPLTSKTTYYLQVVVAGGTAPAGTIYAFFDYDAPVF